MSRPTRLPYGLSYVKPFTNSIEYTLENSVTPNVSNGTYFLAANSAITITHFLGGERGKVIHVTANSGNATTLLNIHLAANDILWLNNIVYSISSGIMKYSSTGGNITLLDGETITLVHTGLYWSQIGTRFVDLNMI